MHKHVSMLSNMYENKGVSGFEVSEQVCLCRTSSLSPPPSYEKSTETIILYILNVHCGLVHSKYANYCELIHSAKYTYEVAPLTGQIVKQNETH